MKSSLITCGASTRSLKKNARAERLEELKELDSERDRIEVLVTFLHDTNKDQEENNARAHHDPVWARDIAIRLYPGDSDAIWAAYLHLLVDDVCTRDPVYKRLLEMKVKMWKQSKKEIKK